MSYGAGHIMDMIQRMKQNRSLMASKRNRFKIQLRNGNHVEDTDPERLYFPEVSEEELHRIKLQIRFKALQQRKRERVAYGIAIFVVVVFILLVLLWI
jgi:hypothetical protein